MYVDLLSLVFRKLISVAQARNKLHYQVSNLAQHTDFLEEYYNDRCTESRHLQFKHAMFTRMPRARRRRRLRLAFQCLHRRQTPLTIRACLAKNQTGNRVLTQYARRWQLHAHAFAFYTWKAFCTTKTNVQTHHTHHLYKTIVRLVLLRSARAFHTWRLQNVALHCIVSRLSRAAATLLKRLHVHITLRNKSLLFAWQLWKRIDVKTSVDILHEWVVVPMRGRIVLMGSTKIVDKWQRRVVSHAFRRWCEEVRKIGLQVSQSRYLCKVTYIHVVFA